MVLIQKVQSHSSSGKMMFESENAFIKCFFSSDYILPFFRSLNISFTLPSNIFSISCSFGKMMFESENAFNKCL